MLRNLLILVLCAPLAACGDGDGGGNNTPTKPTVELRPADASTGIAIGERVQALIDRADGDECRFVMADTELTVTAGGTPVNGSLVYFVDGLRIDFTPSGLFEFDTTYSVSLTTDCAEPATATFTTLSAPATSPTILAGDVMRIDSLTISEPQAIAPILRGFLADADLMVKVVSYDSTSLQILGAEGRDANAIDAPVGLRVFTEGGFLFPMGGTFKWPYFQIEGSLSIPIDVPSAPNSEIVLPRFEISGVFFGTSPDGTIPAGAIRAQAACVDVCAVADSDIQLVCANQSSICDENGMLNLIGRFEAPANDLRAYQTIMVTPAADATGVTVDSSLGFTFTRDVNVAGKGDRAVVVELRDDTGTLVAGSVDIDPNGFTASWTPDAELTADTTYTALVVAIDAMQWQFTTAP